MARNTILTKWVNPKPSSIEIVYRKKAINNYNVEGKQVKWVRYGEVKYIDWNKYQFEIYQDTSLSNKTRQAAYKQIDKDLRIEIEKQIGG